MTEDPPTADIAPPPLPVGRWWIWTSEDISHRLAERPLLRHLLFERRFRCAWFGCALVVGLISAGLPKVWIVTPPGISPVIRVSWIDMVEASVRAGMARNAETHRRFDEAAYHWRAAVLLDPGDPALLRRSISNLIRLPPRDAARFSRAIGDTLWLLRLTSTNAADLDLAVEACEHYRVDDLLLRLTGALQRPTPRQQGARVKALLRRGSEAAFSEARAKLPPGAATEDPELRLYDSAAQANWGGPTASAGRRVLEEAKRSGPLALREQALRLLLSASYMRRDLAAYDVNLAGLRDLHRDQPLEHAAHWDLLHRAGRRDEAVGLALRFADPPVSSTEVLGLTEAFLRLGLEDHAIRLLRRFVPTLGVTSDVWLAHTELLVRQQRWEELHEVALEIRRNDLTRISLGGFSHYLDGLAEISQGRTHTAMAAFAKAPSLPIRDEAVALRTARDLLAHGASAPARELLRDHEPALRSDPGYWQTMQQAAYRTRDAALLLEAARRHHALAPDQPGAANDLAAALIINRQDPALLLGLTHRGLATAPTALATRLNHAFALLQNGLPAAAGPMLLAIDERGLGPLELTMVALARAELAAAEDRPSECLQAVDRVQRRFLLPPQTAWLDRMRIRMQERTAAAR